MCGTYEVARPEMVKTEHATCVCVGVCGTYEVVCARPEMVKEVVKPPGKPLGDANAPPAPSSTSSYTRSHSK